MTKDRTLTLLAVCLGFIIVIYVIHLARGPERHPDRILKHE